MTLAELERWFPGISWREPVKVTLPNGEGGYACRVCIAVRGLMGSEIRFLPASADVVAAHIVTEHLAK